MKSTIRTLSTVIFLTILGGLVFVPTIGQNESASEKTTAPKDSKEEVSTPTLANAAASNSSNPFKSIVRRNAFSLKEKVDPKKNKEKEEEKVTPPDDLDLIINGVSRRGKKQFVYFKIPDEKDKGKFRYYTVDVDDTRANPIDVVKMEDKSIKIKYKGGTYDLNFADVKNKVNRVASNQKGAKGGTNKNIPGRNTKTNVNTSRSSSNKGNYTRSNNGSYTISNNTGSRLNSTSNSGRYSYRSSSSGSGSLNLPKRTVRVGNTNSNISPEEQAVIMEVNRIRNEQQGIPMPPTPGLPETTVQAGGGN